MAMVTVHHWPDIEKGISEEAIVKVQPLFNFTGNIAEKIEKLSKENKPGEELTSAFNEVIPKINEIVKALIQKIS